MPPDGRARPDESGSLDGLAVLGRRQHPVEHDLNGLQVEMELLGFQALDVRLHCPPPELDQLGDRPLGAHHDALLPVGRSSGTPAQSYSGQSAHWAPWAGDLRVLGRRRCPANSHDLETGYTAHRSS